MRVCHVVTLTRWGGVERMLVDLLEDVGARPGPVEHRVLTTSSIPELRAAVAATGLEHAEPRRRIRFDPTALIQMAAWLRARRIQVVHSYNTWSNTWGALAAALAGIPALVAGEHGTVGWVRSPMAILDALAYRRATVAVASSQMIARELQRRYRIPSAKVRVVYNAVAPLPAVDLAAMRAGLGLPPGPIIGAVGRLTAVKDFQTFVRAAAHVLRQRPDVNFVLVGGGPQEEALRRLVAAEGLGGRFLLTGWRADARALIQCFDLIVSTSLYESFGNVMAEAALAGKAVIAAGVGGVPEVVVDGVSGELLTPTIAPQPLAGVKDSPPLYTQIDGQRVPVRSLEPAALAAAIVALLNDPQRQARYGAAGRARAMELFSIGRYRQELEAIYTQVAPD